MDRRKFIKSAVAVGVVAALPLEKLWYPSKEWILEHSSVMWVYDTRPPFPRIPSRPKMWDGLIDYEQHKTFVAAYNHTLDGLIDAGIING